MVRDERHADTTQCPNAEVLAAYSSGKLPAGVFESVAAHLSRCPRCESFLDQYDGNDSLVTTLRRHLGGQKPVESTARGSRTVVDSRRGQRLALPRRWGQYELLEEIGRGGMGVVYKARQLPLNRVVAVKIARTGPFADVSVLARLRTEVEAIARLRHENIVCVHEFGEEDGCKYFSMEFVDGGNLADRLSAGRMAEREAAGLVRVLAAAVDFAHRHDVIHRDLKPANVLLGAGGAMKLSDFGLAKLLDDDRGHTRDDTILGTAGYMAPEMARGQANVSGVPADVYGLGAILYEALTGRPPFKAETHSETLRQVQTLEPEPPSRLRPHLDRTLEAICLRCLAKEPSGRYTSAEALADDLGRWLDGRPTQARRPRWPVRLWHAARRSKATRRAALAAAAACILALIFARSGPEPAERAIADIESTLARGENVVLIGETGQPRWSRWCIQDDANQAPGSRGRGFSVESWGCALLELVRDPQWPSYRLRAEVRHVESHQHGEVGLFLAHREHVTSAGVVHQMLRFSFDDINPGTPVSLSPYLRGDVGGRAFDLRVEGKSRGVNVAPGFRRTTWRKLVVEVTPNTVRAVWDDGQPIGKLPVEDIGRQTAGAVTKQIARQGDESLKDLAKADFAPRGSLGLFVYRGVAAFRSVVIEPDPGGNLDVE
ncbi:MAG TPA: protein kinase [Gemmataceae bacterium]|nr:protein kinase [Gemmataceae bacterium]